jgi:hypothetical protein
MDYILRFTRKSELTLYEVSFLQYRDRPIQEERKDDKV